MHASVSIAFSLCSLISTTSPASPADLHFLHAFSGLSLLSFSLSLVFAYSLAPTPSACVRAAGWGFARRLNDNLITVLPTNIFANNLYLEIL